MYHSSAQQQQQQRVDAWRRLTMMMLHRLAVAAAGNLQNPPDMIPRRKKFSEQHLFKGFCWNKLPPPLRKISVVHNDDT